MKTILTLSVLLWALPACVSAADYDFAAMIQSGDGLRWQPAAHPKVIANRYAWADGSVSITQLERPALLFDGETPVALFGAADGYMKGGRISSNVQIRLKERPSRSETNPRPL